MKFRETWPWPRRDQTQQKNLLNSIKSKLYTRISFFEFRQLSVRVTCPHVLHKFAIHPTSIQISSGFRLTCKSDTTTRQDKKHSQKDSEFNTSRVSTVIIGKYPNFAGFRWCIRRVSLLNISEYTLNMSTSNKSVMRSYYTTGRSFKSTDTVGNTGSTPAGTDVVILRVKNWRVSGVPVLL